MTMKKRIVLEVSERFHEDIKKRSKNAHVTVKAYVLNALIKHIKEEYESGTVYGVDVIKLPPRHL